MDNYTSIKEGLLKHGFKEEEEDHFYFENKSYNTVNINGMVSKQEIKTVIDVVYIGVGGNMEDSDCLDDIYYFDILQDDKQVVTVGVYDFKELAEILNIKINE